MQGSFSRKSIGIQGMGKCIPKKKITNDDLARRLDTSDEWIRSHIGVGTRYVVEPHEATSDLAIEAARMALDDAAIAARDIDLILVARVFPDHRDPATACLVQHRLGATRAGAFDIAAGGCPGSVAAMVTGINMIAGGGARRVLVILADAVTKHLVNWNDRTTCVFFGDGAGAVLLGETDGFEGVLSHCFKSDGSGYEKLIMPGGGSRLPITATNIHEGLEFLRMDGQSVWGFATNAFPESVQTVLAIAGKTVDDLDLVISHQANINIIREGMRRLGLPLSKTYTNIEQYGNTGGPSAVIALQEAFQQDCVHSGGLVAMTSFGAGLSWGAVLFRRCPPEVFR